MPITAARTSRPNSNCTRRWCRTAATSWRATASWRRLAGAPRSAPDWGWNNPLGAVDAFLARHAEFVLEEPAFPFNEGKVRQRVTYWPKAFLRRVA